MSDANGILTIVDYGMGNLRSVQKACERIGVPALVTDRPAEVQKASKLILPGVGAFQDAMDGLRERGLIEPLLARIDEGTPFLGICLGLQLLFSESFEDGRHEGLGLIPGKVTRFAQPSDPSLAKLKIPHMGWNRVQQARRAPLLEGVPDGAHMYFVHSYYVVPEDESVVATTTEYGVRFVSMIWRGNIYATQFHPEKSQTYGLKMLENFGRL